MSEEQTASQAPADTGAEVEVEPISYTSPWKKDSGYLDELSKVCDGLDGLDETFELDSETRMIIATIRNAKTPADLDVHTNNILTEWKHLVQQSLPRVERKLLNFHDSLARAKTVAVEVDFI